MSQDIEYNNFNVIISSGDDFSCEIKCLKTKILPLMKARFSKTKHFSLNFFDLIYPNPKSVDKRSSDLNDFVLLNLDSINENGSICICLIGEQFENPSSNNKNNENHYLSKINKSIELASQSGHSWIVRRNEEPGLSLIEILSLYAGLKSDVKYPLFYFRVSGSSTYSNEAETNYSYIDNQRNRMENLKQKLIKKSVSIKFYGSDSEFQEAVEADLNKIFTYFQDKIPNQDALFIDQQCFEKEYKKIFIPNNNIKRIFQQLDSFCNSFEYMAKAKDNSVSSGRIDELLKEFYRKEFSDRLRNTYNTINQRLSTQSYCCKDHRILILTGPRGAGKSTILTNWLSRTDKDDKTLYISHYCESSIPSSGLRLMLRRIIKQIRIFFGFSIVQDNDEIHTLEDELVVLSQEFLSTMLLAKYWGYFLVIIIDGLDHIGDKCASSAKKIKTVDWIPEVIPENVRIIMSCVDSDSSLIKLKEKRMDLEIVELFSESEDLQKEYIESGIAGLNGLVSSFSQILPDKFLQNLHDWSLIKIPLSQKILARVYHTLGTTSDWHQFIDKISECQTLIELIKRVLKLFIYYLNWEIIISSEKLIKKKFIPKKDEEIEKRSIQGWVPDCLSLLALSREGLEIDSLLSSLELLGYVKEYQVFESDIWSLFHFTRDFMLRFHKNKFTFSNSICREIVLHIFLAIANCSSVEARTRECLDSLYVDKRCKLHILLAYSSWNSRYRDNRNVLECIHHLDKASDTESIRKILFLPCVLLQLFNLNVENLNDWQGQIESAYQFQYFWGLLNVENNNISEHIKMVLLKFYNLDLHLEIDDTIRTESAINQSSAQKKCVVSDFSQNLAIQIAFEDEQKFVSDLSDNEKCRLLLLLGQICVLMNQKGAARKIFNHIVQICHDNVLVCHVLWFDIKLDSSYHFVKRNNSYIGTVLKKLNGLTKDLLDNRSVDDQNLLDQIKYLRCLGFVLKHSISLLISRGHMFSVDYLQIKLYVDDLKSVKLACIVQELLYNSKESNDNIQIIQDKISLLSDLIIMLETWTGTVHRHVAKLIVNLAKLLKIGNSQSKFKSEACCRKALWIWENLRFKNECQYNKDENECREMLINLLLEYPSYSSLIEAKDLLYKTFDSRMKYLGCYDPLTVQLVPIIKLVNSMDFQFPTKISREKKVFSFRNVHKRYKSLSEIQISPNFLENRFISNSNIDRSRKLSSTPSLQFINRYSSGTDYFSEDIDWNTISNSRTNSRSSKTSGSRLTSANSKIYSSRYLNDNNTQKRCHSMFTENEIPKYIYLGDMSSISSLTTGNYYRDKKYSSNSEKQVRFNTMDTSVKKHLNHVETSLIIQRKLQNMNLI